MVLNGNLQGKPTLIVAGRSDALAPVNNTAANVPAVLATPLPADAIGFAGTSISVPN